jgi:hypothetical protein
MTEQQATEKFYRDAEGKFLGVFVGAAPDGGIECAAPPADGRMVWNGSAWVAGPGDRILTPRQFRLRLTDEEQGAIIAAAMSDAQVLAWRLAAAEAQEIDLDHPDTIAGVAFLVSTGLLTESRAAEVLA